MTDYYVNMNHTRPRTGHTRKGLRATARVAIVNRSPEVINKSPEPVLPPQKKIKLSKKGERWLKKGLVIGGAVALLGAGVKNFTEATEAQKPKVTHADDSVAPEIYEVEPGDIRSGLVYKYIDDKKIEEKGYQHFEDEIIDDHDPTVLQADENVTFVGDMAESLRKHPQHPDSDK